MTLDHHYDVFIGNLQSTVSTEQLRDLFSQVGRINHIWINRSFEKITYGFIGFDNLYAAEEACSRFNNETFDSLKITVRVSEQTKLKTSAKRKTERHNDSSILLELSKKENKCKSYQLKLHLLKDLRQNKEIINDFIQAMSEAENITFSDFNIVKTDPEPPSLTALESTIVRYFKSTDQKKPLQVDFDLSKGKLLTNQQYDKFFNLKLSKPRPSKTQRKVPFALDYRSVVN